MSLLNSFIRSTAFIENFYYLNLKWNLKWRGESRTINNKQILDYIARYIGWFITSREQYGTCHWQILRKTAAD